MTVKGLYKTGLYNINPVYISKNSNYSCPTSFKGTDEDSFVFSQDLMQKKTAKKLVEKAEEALAQENNKEAINCFQEAIRTYPECSSAYYGLARIYKNTKQTSQAINTYEKLIRVKPDDLEARTLLGQCYKKNGDLKKAKSSYKAACDIDPKFDYAARSLKEIDNLLLAQVNPKFAKQQKDKQSEKNLRDSVTLVLKNSPQHILNKIADVDFSFGKTDSLSGHPNIAQYENSKRKIVVTEDYIWAAPQVVAAYLVHESIHASDKDGITSIYEEQDAYEESIKFWAKNNNGVKDPELDYATELYKQSPQKLRQKVEEIYSSRDKGIPKTSPNHPPGNKSTGVDFFGFNINMPSLDLLGKNLGALIGLKSD